MSETSAWLRELIAKAKLGSGNQFTQHTGSLRLASLAPALALALADASEALEHIQSYSSSLPDMGTEEQRLRECHKATVKALASIAALREEP